MERIIGDGVMSRLPHWRVDLKGFQVQFFVQLIENVALIGVRLGDPHHKWRLRNRAVSAAMTSLKPPIAYRMIRTARLSNDMVVCDPMCGIGTIPIEGAVHKPGCFHLGMQIIDFITL